MAKERPNLSITLPRNFHFSYAEGALPKTPEREIPSQDPISPQAYRLRRRSGRTSRASIMDSATFRKSEPTTNTVEQGVAHQDVPIPTIEVPDHQESPLAQKLQTSLPPASGLLIPTAGRAWNPPRTPEAQCITFGEESWSPTFRKDVGDTIARPTSGFSAVTDSSDDSDVDSDDGFSYSGNCTSPESDASEIMYHPALKSGMPAARLSFEPESPIMKRSKHSKASRVFWTSDMDNHIWTIYMRYLQDPTVTPFKTLPGAPPPLGVCHRVAREARRGWKGPKETTQALVPRTELRRGGSSDTITAHKSGSNTPTELAVQKIHVWPKSGSSTRRRLRALCKRKATISPHYQRLLKSRSPSPFSSSARPSSRAVRASSPPAASSSQTSFATRDIQVSLTTSTSETMQPHGPLAQLTRQPSSASTLEWFNDPSIPWASPAAAPSSDVFIHHTEMMSSSDLPSLGSPFGNNTWGPSRSRQHARPSTARTHSENVRGSVPRLNSPIHLRYPYPSSNHKRRAQTQLEDELGPSGTDIRRPVTEDLFGGPAGSQRRVRSRGFTTGEALTQGRLSSIHASYQDAGSQTIHGFTTPPRASSLQSPPQLDSVRRLGSPFAGISSRPARVRRHLASSSLPVWDPTNVGSIDQRLEHFNNGMDQRH